MRKKVDQRIRTLIENAIKQGHRSLFVIVGDRARDQVVNLHFILNKSRLKKKPTVLWCYNKTLDLSSHNKKRMKQINQKKAKGMYDEDIDNPFTFFVKSNEIRYCYYKEVDTLNGATYNMLVLQDFDTLTPNILCNTIEAIEGGGVIVLLLSTMSNLKRLYNLTMSTQQHAETFHNLEPRFNDRFLLSLSKCQSCLVIDDEINVLPISSYSRELAPLEIDYEYDANTPSNECTSYACTINDDLKPLGLICKTLDQIKALDKCAEYLSKKGDYPCIFISGAKGVGKSSLLGLVIAQAINNGYGRVQIVGVMPIDVGVLFEFIIKGLDAFGYIEHSDYECFLKNGIRTKICVTKNYKQTVEFIPIKDCASINADLVVADEISQTISEKIYKIKEKSALIFGCTDYGFKSCGYYKSENIKKILSAENQIVDIKLSQPIKYGINDSIHDWMNDVACLNIFKEDLTPYSLPGNFELYYVDRTALFSGKIASELLLHKIMSLFYNFTSIDPNQLQSMADAPGEGIFILLPTIQSGISDIPDVLCAIEVVYEGSINKQYIAESIKKGVRPKGDMIPWIITEQYQDHNFNELSGARIVRIAARPNSTGNDFAELSIQLLKQYYEGVFYDKENCKTDDAILVESEYKSEALGAVAKEDEKPILQRLHQRKPICLHYVGVSYELTMEQFKFWSKNKFMPVYIKPGAESGMDNLSCVMIYPVTPNANIFAADVSVKEKWWEVYTLEFINRFVSLLGYDYRNLNLHIVMGILSGEKNKRPAGNGIMVTGLSKLDIKRLGTVAQKIDDYRLIMDLLPLIARQYFKGKLLISLNKLLQAVMAGMGLQYKDIDVIANELGISDSDVLEMLSKLTVKTYKYIIDNSILPNKKRDAKAKIKKLRMEEKSSS